MRRAWVGLLLVVACKKDDRSAQPVVVDAAADAMVGAGVDAAASNIPLTPGALARFPDSPLMDVVALGDRHALLVRTSAHVFERDKDGSFRFRSAASDPEAIVLVPTSGGDPETIADTRHIDARCTDGADFTWVEAQAGGARVFVVSAGKTKPRAVTTLPADARVTALTCRAAEAFAILEGEPEGGRIVRIDEADGTMKTLARGTYAPGLDTFTRDRDGLYWFDDGPAQAVMHLPIAGGAPRPRFTAPKEGGGIGHLYADVKGLYWTLRADPKRRLYFSRPGAAKPVILAEDIEPLGGGFFARGRAIERPTGDGASLERVLSDVSWKSGFAANGGRGAWLVHARGDDLTQPGELHLVARAFEPAPR